MFSFPTTFPCKLILAVSITYGLPAITSQAQTTVETAAWNQFRGPNGSGIATEADPPIEFNQDTNLLWSTSLPPGLSSPVLWSDRIFLTGLQDKTFETICLNRNTGEILWRKAAPQVEIEPHYHLNSPATSTPRTT